MQASLASIQTRMENHVITAMKYSHLNNTAAIWIGGIYAAGINTNTFVCKKEKVPGMHQLICTLNKCEALFRKPLW